MTCRDVSVVADRLVLARIRSNKGLLLREQGKYGEAEEVYRQVLKVQQKQVDEFPAVPPARRELADSYHGLGIVLAELKKEAEAETVFQQALALRKKLTPRLPAPGIAASAWRP